MEKIKVKEITGTKEGGTPPKTWKITKFITENGLAYDTFDQVEVGKEYEGEVTKNANPAYADQFKVNKPKKGFGGASKNYDKEFRIAALNNASRLYASGVITSTDGFLLTRDKFLQWLRES